jgi:hypothetical protein
MIYFVLCLALLQLATPDDEFLFAHHGIAVSVRDSYGEFTLYQNATATVTEQEISCKLKRLQELDSQFSKSGLSSTTNFDTFVWNDFVPTMVGGNPASTVDGSAWLDMNNFPFQFNMSITAFDTTTSLVYGPLFVTVPADAVKFSYNIGNYVWTNAQAEYLQLTIELVFKGGDPNKSKNKNSQYSTSQGRRLSDRLDYQAFGKGNNASITTVDAGSYDVLVVYINGQTVEFPEVAMIDGKEMNITVNGDVHGSSTVTVDMTFPRFAFNASYDPTMSLSTSSGASVMSVASLTLSTLLIISSVICKEI